MLGVFVPEGTNDCGAKPGDFGVGIEVDPLPAADLVLCQRFPVGCGAAAPAPHHSHGERTLVLAGAEGLHGRREDGKHVARRSASPHRNAHGLTMNKAPFLSKKRRIEPVKMLLWKLFVSIHSGSKPDLGSF